jgi:hypothetical protein
MRKIVNVFVLTTEYHFLLSMSIILDKYASDGFRNVLVFTGPRLSDVAINSLPPFVETVEIFIDTEMYVKKKIQETFFQAEVRNVFVFTAYRFLETFVLCKVPRSVKRHLVQDGANFYATIKNSVFIRRLKETVGIYRNLWKKGFFFITPVLYKKHLAQSSLVDFVWVTNPEVYVEPRWSRKPVIKIDLLKSERAKEVLMKCFSRLKIHGYDNYLIYLTTRLTEPDAIELEIEMIKSLTVKFRTLNLLVKLHPHSPAIQVNHIQKAFGAKAVKNYVPAELYIMNAKNTCVVGAPSAGFFFENPMCNYFCLEKIYQKLEIWPQSMDIHFPHHVKKPETLSQI